MSVALLAASCVSEDTHRKVELDPVLGPSYPVAVSEREPSPRKVVKVPVWNRVKPVEAGFWKENPHAVDPKTYAKLQIRAYQLGLPTEEEQAAIREALQRRETEHSLEQLLQGQNSYWQFGSGWSPPYIPPGAVDPRGGGFPGGGTVTPARARPRRPMPATRRPRRP